MGTDGGGPLRALFRDLLGRRPRPKRDLVKEIEGLIEAGKAEGLFNADEEDMLLSILSFRKTLVREVAVPRTEMVTVEVGAALEDLARTMVQEGHSRVPIYEGDVDHVVGFVTARDVLHFWGAPPPYPPLRTLLRPAYFVPETMSLEALLAEFRRRRLQLAIAVDEYGGVSGLATLEDVLEEIVGDIQDEYDEEDAEIREASDGLRVDARTELEKLEERLGIELGKDVDYETVGGLVFHALGRVPKAGETFRYGGLEVVVLDADRRRVKEVKVRRLPQEEPRGDRPDTPVGD
ncbi:MAG: hemolysin family protein [Deferrisomatales bacterium]|nr:hemolysin family protein [Deferrisomatales bacterium]